MAEFEFDPEFSIFGDVHVDLSCDADSVPCLFVYGEGIELHPAQVDLARELVAACKQAKETIERLREESDQLKIRIGTYYAGNADGGIVKRLEAEIEWLRHQIGFIQNMILRHKAEQTADPRCMCSEMDANLWAWAEDREGDLR
jgi:hypothetical protein